MPSIGRLRVSVELSRRLYLRPIINGRFERDPYLQDRDNCLWDGDIHWLWWWIQIVWGKG